MGVVLLARGAQTPVPFVYVITSFEQPGGFGHQAGSICLAEVYFETARY